jgi:hypothetical protein
MFRLNNMPEKWGQAMMSKSFRKQFILTLITFAVVCLHQFHYLRLFQARPGIQINDYILNLLPPHDFSLPIFILEYSTLLMVFFSVLPNPEKLVRGLQMASIVILARTMSVYFFALEPPKDMMLLNDPVAVFFLHTKDVFVTKDLFFSGHISFLALLVLIAGNKYLKTWAFTATVCVGAMLLFQHCHYTLDVLFAPVFSYVAYKFVLYIHRETRYGLQLQGQEL